MTDPRIEAERVLKQMNEEDQRRAIRTFFQMKSAKTQREVELILENSPENIKEFIVLSVMSSIENHFLEDKKRSLKQKDEVIRVDATKILCALLSAGGDESDDVLLQRSMNMAKRLHEYF